MSRVHIEKLVTAWTEEIVEGTELELVDVEYVKEPSGWILRVFIDKPAGVDLEDCRQVSEALDQRLDAEDPIPGPYLLEVSSPGLERPLKKRSDYERFAGRRVEIRTYGAIHGRKRFEATLQGLQGDNVVLEWEGETIEIPLELISKANLVLEL
ncbi:MAG: ribosome maturation factor RimP [Firmicutes bacterium]|nr:ribosome maturation factor RimP [Bacillota bacterium]